MLQPNDLPLVCLPTELSGDAAAKLVEFLHELSDAIERHYFAQIHQHRHADVGHHDLEFSEPTRDPPF